jgi:hypothetical protein
MVVDMNGTIGKAVATYTGGLVERLEVIADSVPGTYACMAIVRRHRERPLVLQFILRGVALHRVTENDIEECDFTSWPPRSL